jgi:hypothetical protein
VGRKQTPASMHAHLLNRFQYRIAACLVQMIGGLIHKLCLESAALYLQDRGSRRIVPAVDGAGFAAVQMGSIASEGDQVNHCEPNSTAPLRSRLCLKYPYARILSIGRNFGTSLTSTSRTRRPRT